MKAARLRVPRDDEEPARSLAEADWSRLRIAIVADWLAVYGGAERVIEQFLHLFPHADLYALGDFLDADARRFLQGRIVHTSFLQRVPFARRIFRQFLPIMPLLIEQFDLSGYDLILSSNHAVAKGVLTRADQLHVSYVHTPIRYAWDLQDQYLRDFGLVKGLRGAAVRLLMHYLRLWDRVSANGVDVFVANSRSVAGRIWRSYRREAHVVFPPVDVDAYTFCDEKDDFYLTASRLVPYKRIDLIVDAFTRMPHRRLIVIGTGPEYKKIAAKAGPNVTLLGYQATDVLRQHMQRARAFVFAAHEEFGIVPVEAQACGTPVIAYGRGGATETVIDGDTGLFFGEQTVESLCDCVDRFESLREDFDPEIIRSHAESFSVERFHRQFADLAAREWNAFQARWRPDESFANV